MGVPLKMLGALAVAGMAATGSSAITGAGMVSAAPASQFIGGQVSQAVTGAVLNSVVYSFIGGDVTQTEIKDVTLTFNSDAAGKTVAITPTGAAYGGTATHFLCTDVGTSPYTSVCTPWTTASPDAQILTGYMTGVTSLAITVT